MRCIPSWSGFRLWGGAEIALAGRAMLRACALLVPEGRGFGLCGNCAFQVAAGRNSPRKPDQSPGRIACATPLLVLVIHRQAVLSQPIARRKSGAISGFSCPAFRESAMNGCESPGGRRTCLAFDPPRDRMSAPSQARPVVLARGIRHDRGNDRQSLSSHAKARFSYEIPPRRMKKLDAKRVERQLDFLLELTGSRQCCVNMAHRRFAARDDAEHSWHIAVMAIVLAEHSADPGIDLLRC